MKRIIIHWTAGGHNPTATDLEHYHEVIDGKGNVHTGEHPIADNASTADGDYAAHTRGCNTGSIGIAVAAMAGAVERPFSAGRYPVTNDQVAALCARVAYLAKLFGIPVTRETILTHAEVERTLGIAQRGKWDITWLPGMKAPGDAIAVGDQLRAKISLEMKG